MKVLFLSSWFPTRIQPFNGDFVERHAIAVSRICRTAVIHVQADDSMIHETYEVIEKNKAALYEIIVYYRKKKSKIRLFSGLTNLCRYGRGHLMGFRLLRQKYGKPDIIHANIIYPVAMVAWFYRLFAAIPYIVSEHWTQYLPANKDRISLPWIAHLSVKWAFALVPVTHNLEQALRVHKFRCRYFVVPNVVDTTLFKPGTFTGESGQCRFLHVSSMKEQQKNITGMLRAFRRLSEIRNDFTVTFVGNASEYQQALPEELGIPEGTIRFTGEISHEEVALAMQRADVFVMFSRIENLPCVILEAWSCGLPVISSDVGGIGEWMKQENGILVESENEDELLKGMVFLLEHYKQFSKDKMHQFVEDQFGQDIIARRFFGIYQNALKEIRNV